MIEDIKKEVVKNHTPAIDKNGQINGYIWLSDLIQILDKYKDIEEKYKRMRDLYVLDDKTQDTEYEKILKYKNAWEELKEQDGLKTVKPFLGDYKDYTLDIYIKELETKHNIGREE